MSAEMKGSGDNSHKRDRQRKDRPDASPTRLLPEIFHAKEGLFRRRERRAEPQVAVYPHETVHEHPEWHRRGVKEYNSSWKEFLNQPPFDDLLLEQLHSAQTRGQNRVVVLDLGGGEHRFARQFLSQSEFGEKTREYLTQHDDMEVKIVSLTDALTADEFLRPQTLAPLENAEPLDNSHIEAIAIPYSVTSQQTLSQFLDHAEIPQIDLVVSIGFLPYLRPNVFEQVLTDLQDRLSEKGVAVLCDYQSTVDLSKDDLPSNTREPIELGRVDSQTLREEAEELLADDHTPDDELLKMYRKINKTLMSSGAFPFPILGVPEGYPTEVTERTLLAFAIEQTIPKAERLVHSQEVAEEKLVILDELQESDSAEIDYTDKGIVIKKRS